MSFVSIGKELKCSDNMVRRYCIGYNLPSTKKEIKQYSEEEWKQI